MNWYPVGVGTVENNLPCVTCGYALRGLPEDGACPECGTDVRRSLRGDSLPAANPAWLRTIVRGQWLLTIGLMMAAGGALIILLCGVALLLFEDALGMISTTGLLIIGLMIGFAVILLAVPIGVCIALIGIFFVTVQEGRDTEDEPMGSARNLARWSMLGAIVTGAIFQSMSVLPATGGMWWGLDLFFRSVFIVLLTVAGGALLRRLESLLQRVPDHDLAEEVENHWKFIRLAVPAAGICLLILPATGWGGGGAGVVALVACVGFIAVIGLLISLFLLTGTMLACSKRLQGCLASAIGAIAEESPRTSTGGAS